MEKPKRPASVTIIAWVTVVSGGVSLATAPLTLITPEGLRALQIQPVSPAVAIAAGVIGGIVNLAAGLAMLKGLNWSRVLFVYYGLASTIFTLAAYGLQPIQIVGIVVYLIFVVLLLRPRASSYFGGGIWPGQKPVT
ncbi:MAG: hypothetical protein HY671_04710 [Chloroflexi bacterium]|nr:hypothetical protein [Chloroflexota bacterium]